MFSEWYYFESSTRVECARVDRETNLLDLKFVNGPICRYEGAADQYDGIISCESPGKYVHNNLKGWSYTIVGE